MTNLLRGGMALPLILLGGCALQPDYHRPPLNAPASWSNAPVESAPPRSAAPASGDSWWSQLGDPAIDRLVAAGLSDNPTLAQAVARVDQARAALTVSDAAKLPAIGIEGSATRARDRLNPAGGLTSQRSAALGARLSWEIDIWKRVREGAKAARQRVSARTADADGARLAVIGDIADTTIALRACNLTLAVRDRDIASRESELTISRARLSFGTIAPVVVATARSNLATARTDRISQDETCRRLVDALVSLSGLAPDSVRDMLATEGIPTPPSSGLALPATVLLGNPGVRAAESEAAARWSEIAVARAERMPRIDLTALFTGQWIRALGSETSFTSNSIGATLAAPLFDGGTRAANVRGAKAAYRAALAQLTLAARNATRDIEDALAAQQLAALRIGTSQETVDSARFALAANEARWRSGAIAQFELEDARRQLNRAQQGLIQAEADRARAWVALMRRTGPTAPSPGRGALPS